MPLHDAAFHDFPASTSAVIDRFDRGFFRK